MRIALAVARFPPHVGGAERYAARLADELAARGHGVRVYTARHPGRSRPPHAAPRIDGTRSPLPYTVRGFRALAPPGSGHALWPGLVHPAILRELGGADVLHAVGFSSSSTLAWLVAGRLLRKPLVLTALYHPPHANVRPRLNAAYDRTAGRLILGVHDAVLVHSSVERRALLRHVSPDPRTRLRSMPLPPSLEGVDPGGSFRGRLGLGGRYLALCVGRIDSHKGIATLLAAAGALGREGSLPELAVAIVGPGEAWYRLPPSARDLAVRLRHVVTFAGTLPDPELAAAYAESDVVVLPSRYESYGFSIVDALSRGTPVISTRTGAAPDVIRPGENGYLFDYGDVAELKRQLALVRAGARGMRQSARASVEGLSWRRTVDEILGIYGEVGRRFARDLRPG